MKQWESTLQCGKQWPLLLSLTLQCLPTLSQEAQLQPSKRETKEQIQIMARTNRWGDSTTQTENLQFRSSWGKKGQLRKVSLPLNVSLHFYHWKVMTLNGCLGRWEDGVSYLGSVFILMLVPTLPMKKRQRVGIRKATWTFGGMSLSILQVGVFQREDNMNYVSHLLGPPD